MSIPSGLAAQIGYKSEAGTPGVAVTVDRFVPLVSETLTREPNRLESEGMLAGRRIHDSRQWRDAEHKIEGGAQHSLTDNTIGLLLEHALGGKATTGAGPYTHTFTPATLTGKSFTTQVGRPRSDGTVAPFTYAGCKVMGMSIAGAVGQLATLGLDIFAMTEDTGTALATASYGADDDLFTFVQGLLTVGGSAPAGVISSFELNIDNALKTDRYTAGSAAAMEALEQGHRLITGSFTCEFENMTQRNRYINGTEAEVILGFDDGANELKFTMNCRFDGGNPNVDGPDILTLDVPFKAIGDGSDADAITAVLINDDSTA